MCFGGSRLLSLLEIPCRDSRGCMGYVIPEVIKGCFSDPLCSSFSGSML